MDVLKKQPQTRLISPLIKHFQCIFVTIYRKNLSSNEKICFMSSDTHLNIKTYGNASVQSSLFNNLQKIVWGNRAGKVT